MITFVVSTCLWVPIAFSWQLTTLGPSLIFVCLSLLTLVEKFRAGVSFQLRRDAYSVLSNLEAISVFFAGENCGGYLACREGSASRECPYQSPCLERSFPRIIFSLRVLFSNHFFLHWNCRRSKSLCQILWWKWIHNIFFNRKRRKKIFLHRRKNFSCTESKIRNLEEVLKFLIKSNIPVCVRSRMMLSYFHRSQPLVNTSKITAFSSKWWWLKPSEYSKSLPDIYFFERTRNRFFCCCLTVQVKNARLQRRYLFYSVLL